MEKISLLFSNEDKNIIIKNKEPKTNTKQQLKITETVNDLFLNQVFEYIIKDFEHIQKDKEQHYLQEVFQSPLNDIKDIYYRQDIFKDIENNFLLEDLENFCKNMDLIKGYQKYYNNLYLELSKLSFFLETVIMYVNTIKNLNKILFKQNIILKSEGLKKLRSYLIKYTNSDNFKYLDTESKKIKTNFSKIKYTLKIKGNKVVVKKYNNEKEFNYEIKKIFERFETKTNKIELYKFKNKNYADHIQKMILLKLKKIYPNFFKQLIAFYKKTNYNKPGNNKMDYDKKYHINYNENNNENNNTNINKKYNKNNKTNYKNNKTNYNKTSYNKTNIYNETDSFIDKNILKIDKEIRFYITWLKFINKLRNNKLKEQHLSFCYPELSDSSKEEKGEEIFDIALALNFLNKNNKIITNNYYLKNPERIIIITGPNQGGKTTFAKTLGQIHFLAKLGIPVPGKKVVIFNCDHIFTHFEKEETVTNMQGKLKTDLVRIKEIFDIATSKSLFIINEIFNSTTSKDALILGKYILNKIYNFDALAVYVTFISELSDLNEKTISFVSLIDEFDPFKRTFKIKRKKADKNAFALQIAKKHNLTYDQIMERLKNNVNNI